VRIGPIDRSRADTSADTKSRRAAER
jgi:hypothetical protein